MKKEQRPSSEFQSLTSVHRAMGYPDPKHPLIALINGCIARVETSAFEAPHVLYFYKISLKTPKSGQMRYGQHYYDFDNGGLFFAAPGQVVGPAGDSADRERIEASMNSRYTLLIHPDFFLGHPLAKKIKQYGFFSYSVNEALNLSDEEAESITSVFKMIDSELSNRLDDFSEEVIISQIELLLNFSNRFYKRQFITRKSDSHDLLEKLDDLLNKYFEDDQLVQQGVPTVSWLAQQLNFSPSYLSDMLRSLTGQNAQQHIHSHLIEKAKEVLSTTSLSVSEVAYSLGFEYSQSFNKLFKRKTNLSPLEFREQFN